MHRKELPFCIPIYQTMISNIKWLHPYLICMEIILSQSIRPTILLENVLARCVYQSIQDGRILCENIRYCTAIFGNSKIYIRVFILVCVYVDKQCNSYLLLVAVYSKQTRFRKCNIVLLSKSVDGIYVSVVLMFLNVV